MLLKNILSFECIAGRKLGFLLYFSTFDIIFRISKILKIFLSFFYNFF